jgi:hypothetical protein
LPLGLGGLSSILAASLGRYRLLFTLAAVVLLGVAHFLIYRKKGKKIIDLIVLWVSTIVVVLVLVLF